MRQLERIDIIMSLITMIWSHSQDMRFNQLISALEWEFINQHEDNKKYVDHSYSMMQNGKGIVFAKDVTNVDLFYLEDDKFEAFLIEYLKQKGVLYRG